MSEQIPTDAEAAALGQLGYVGAPVPTAVLAAYRAGHHEGYRMGLDDNPYVITADTLTDAIDELAAELVEAFRARPDIARELAQPPRDVAVVVGRCHHDAVGLDVIKAAVEADKRRRAES